MAVGAGLVAVQPDVHLQDTHFEALQVGALAADRQGGGGAGWGLDATPAEWFEPKECDKVLSTEARALSLGCGMDVDVTPVMCDLYEIRKCTWQLIHEVSPRRRTGRSESRVTHPLAFHKVCEIGQPQIVQSALALPPLDTCQRLLPHLPQVPRSRLELDICLHLLQGLGDKRALHRRRPSQRGGETTKFLAIADSKKYYELLMSLLGSLNVFRYIGETKQERVFARRVQGREGMHQCASTLTRAPSLSSQS